MLIRVLKTFAYSDDGIHSVILNTGDQREVDDSLVKGLIDESFVEPVVEEKPAAPLAPPPPAEAQPTKPAVEAAAPAPRRGQRRTP